MAGYLNQNGNSIGSLLRFIQEQKSQSPMVPPATETGSPIRGVVQEPLKAPEDIGTSKVISLKPEAVVGAGKGSPVSQGVPGGVTPTGIGAPSAPAENVGRTAFGWKGIGGIETPTANISSPTTEISSPKNNVSDVSKSGTTTPSIPSIGTKINQSNRVFSSTGAEITPAQQVLAITEKNKKWAQEMSQPGAISAYLNEGIEPSPTPTPSPSRQQISDIGAQLRQQAGITGTPASQITTKSDVSTAPPQAKKVVTSYTQPAQPAYQAPKQSTAPSQSQQQSVAQQIATVIKKSPWSWLFGR